MWTGNRAETMAGIEDGLPADYRHDLHDRRHEDDNPAGSILMGLNNGWAQRLMEDRGVTPRQMAAAAVKAFDHAARNPLAQCQRTTSIEEVLASPQVAGVLTRLMCSSFTDGGAAVVVGGPGDFCPGHGSPYHRVGGPLRKWTDRLPRSPHPGRRPRRGKHGESGPTTSTWSSCTTPRHPRSSTPSNHSVSSRRARRDRPPRPGTPGWTPRVSWSTRAEDWSGGDTRWGPPGWPRLSSWPHSSAGGPGPAR